MIENYNGVEMHFVLCIKKVLHDRIIQGGSHSGELVMAAAKRVHGESNGSFGGRGDTARLVVYLGPQYLFFSKAQIWQRTSLCWPAEIGDTKLICHKLKISAYIGEDRFYLIESISPLIMVSTCLLPFFISSSIPLKNQNHH
jgi:hypothetical protein